MIRYGNRTTVAPVTYTFIHPILKQRMIMKVGQIFSPSLEEIKELARKNMQYDKK